MSSKTSSFSTLKRSLKSLTSKKSTYVVNVAERDRNVVKTSSDVAFDANSDARIKNVVTSSDVAFDANFDARIKIGKSSFFLTDEPDSYFRTSPILETEVTPIPPVRRKRQAKLEEMRKEKEALEIRIQHNPAASANNDEHSQGSFFAKLFTLTDSSIVSMHCIRHLT